jgi:hypothetical protein
MKIAKEWWRENFMSHLIFSDTIIPIIEQIQLDAFKAGEEHAASLCKPIIHDGSPFIAGVLACEKAILADAKERKELP